MSPFTVLLAALITIPLIEIYALIQVGSAIGAPATIVVVISTAILGAVLLRAQGIKTLSRVQTTLARGQLPAVELIEGLILLVDGALLLTPGFFTDAIGFALLVPAIRRLLARRVLDSAVVTGSVAHPRANQNGDTPRVIEGEFHRDD